MLISWPSITFIVIVDLGKNLRVQFDKILADFTKKKKTEWIFFLSVWFQWRRSQFTYSIPPAFCLSHYIACYLSRTTLSSLRHLSTQNTFYNYLASHHGGNFIQHCLCEDKCTTSSQLGLPSLISPHLCGFWNSYLWATCWITHVSLLVVYGEFLHIPNWGDIESLAPTNLSICLSVTSLAPLEIRSSSFSSFWGIFFDSWHSRTTEQW